MQGRDRTREVERLELWERVRDGGGVGCGWQECSVLGVGRGRGRSWAGGGADARAPPGGGGHGARCGCVSAGRLLFSAPASVGTSPASHAESLSTTPAAPVGIARDLPSWTCSGLGCRAALSPTCHLASLRCGSVGRAASSTPPDRQPALRSRNTSRTPPRLPLRPESMSCPSSVPWFPPRAGDGGQSGHGRSSRCYICICSCTSAVGPANTPVRPFVDPRRLKGRSSRP